MARLGIIRSSASNILGWPKSSLELFVTCNGTIRANLMANSMNPKFVFFFFNGITKFCQVVKLLDCVFAQRPFPSTHGPLQSYPCMPVVQSFQLYLTLCDPMDCSLPGSSVHGVLQVGILEWVAMPSPRDFPNLGIEPASPVSPTFQADSLPTEPPGKPSPILSSQQIELIRA